MPGLSQFRCLNLSILVNRVVQGDVERRRVEVKEVIPGLAETARGVFEIVLNSGSLIFFDKTDLAV